MVLEWENLKSPEEGNISRCRLCIRFLCKELHFRFKLKKLFLPGITTGNSAENLQIIETELGLSVDVIGTSMETGALLYGTDILLGVMRGWVEYSLEDVVFRVRD